MGVADVHAGQPGDVGDHLHAVAEVTLELVPVTLLVGADDSAEVLQRVADRRLRRDRLEAAAEADSKWS